MNTYKKLPIDVGIGLRPCHFDYIEKNQPKVAFFEVLSDNYLEPSGSRLFHLEKICSTYPVTLHGVGMSLGSTDALNFHYLKKLKSLIEFTSPLLVSDHLSWSSFDNKYFHELLPLPYTEETVLHVIQRIQCVQDFLQQQIAIENISNYLHVTYSTLTEWEFIHAVAEEANCLILLDINNIYVSAQNNKFSPENYIENMPLNRIAQFHLAGFTSHDNYLLDTHGEAIHDEVWKIFAKTMKKLGPIATVIEWDNNIPHFEILQKESRYAQKIMENYASFA